MQPGFLSPAQLPGYRLQGKACEVVGGRAQRIDTIKHHPPRDQYEVVIAISLGLPPYRQRSPTADAEWHSERL
jgi:hypothetical protein